MSASETVNVASETTDVNPPSSNNSTAVASSTNTPSTSRSRDTSTRRNRSRSRTRSRHGHREGRSHASHRSRIRFKHKERNFAAAVCSMITIVILCTALSEPRWISLRGGGCTLLHGGDLHYLGAFQFFYNGQFYQDQNSHATATVNEIYKYGPNANEMMSNCVTFRTVLLFKAIIAFSFLGILCSLFAFLLDLMGPTQKALKMLRRNALFSILSVLMCVVINLFCYYVTVYVDELQNKTKLHKGSKVDVTFDVSFYLVTAAGGISVFSVAFNCLRRRSSFEEPRHNYVMNDYDDLNSLLPPPEPEIAPMANLPPPPAYSP
ncbi:hypothetical protein SNE40_007941 [Patella caerulea]|uniref:Transmembrane protein 127 transmembrane region domain-containing protein n=1 Tax=Patella caerulea TaxID=87958 RepID=A0AAN8PVV1_PATCE